MNRLVTVILLFILVFFMNCKKNTSNELITFDVNGGFSIKKIEIQDIADINYLTMEVNENCLFTNFVALSDSFVICKAMNEFLFFDRLTGKFISKINRYGNGPEEYILPVAYVYSEVEDVFFIFDHPAKIKAYGKDGTFKYQFSIRENSYPGRTTGLSDYNENYLLLYDMFQGDKNDYPGSFILISKQDGHTVEEIIIPYENKVNLMLSQGNARAMPSAYYSVRNNKDYLLTEYSSDTVYRLTSECQLIPALVRIPSIQKMETKIILHSFLETSKYLFFSTQKLEFDWGEMSGFPFNGYLMEKCSGDFFQTNIQMRDYREKEFILDASVITCTSNPQTGVIVFNALELHTANEENKLSGKLKEVTDRLTDLDEYVFMILKFK